MNALADRKTFDLLIGSFSSSRPASTARRSISLTSRGPCARAPRRSAAAAAVTGLLNVLDAQRQDYVLADQTAVAQGAVGYNVRLLLRSFKLLLRYILQVLTPPARLKFA